MTPLIGARRDLLVIRGIYTAASGMMAEAARQEAVTNNLANIETTGFKKDLAALRSTPERTVTRIGDGETLRAWRPVIGSLEQGTLVDRFYTLHEQGRLRETGAAFDLALEGDGFFVVETPDGPRYTRNGAFTLDADRVLVDDRGYRVLGRQGRLQIASGEVLVDAAGRIKSNGVEQGRLQLVSFTDNTRLRKTGDNLFAAATELAQQPFDGQVRQGFLESSNVEALSEMVKMMAAQRAYEASRRALLAQDELLGKAVNEVGVVR
jgi:flagellar basal-body rod protein FlgG